MQDLLWLLTSAYMKRVYGWAGGRAGVRYVITKFSRMDSLPNFLTHGAPLRARFARARSSAINWTDLDFHEHFIKQKFHVGKGKCLVKATEREMSVWSIEMSANRKGEARNHLRASYTQIFGCKLRGCKTKEFLLVYYSTFFSFSIHCQCTWSWLVTTWDHYVFYSSFGFWP